MESMTSGVLTPTAPEIWSEVEQKGPFQFGQNGIFGTTSEGGSLGLVGSILTKRFILPSSPQ